MKMSDFINLVASGARPVVEFVAGIDSKESFAEKGMRARALRVRDEDPDVIRIVFDYAEFEGLNLPLQSANYYDKKREPTLTAVEAGFYKPQDHMYVDRGENLEQLFALVTDAQSTLFAQYREATADTPMSYVAWLELELTKARTPSPV